MIMHEMIGEPLMFRPLDEVLEASRGLCIYDAGSGAHEYRAFEIILYHDEFPGAQERIREAFRVAITEHDDALAVYVLGMIEEREEFTDPASLLSPPRPPRGRLSAYWFIPIRRTDWLGTG